MGFGQGLSGLNAASQELDIIGNNIANSGTVGFKSASATFADVYANSKMGLGVQVASVTQRFTVGTISGTGNQFDMAIDGAKGMFRVQDASGNIMYTRNGQFFADKDNNIVNAQGYRLTGYGVTGTDLNPIKVPIGNLAPQVTSTLTTMTNLNANAPLAATKEVPGKVEMTTSPGGVLRTYYFTGTDAAPVWVDENGKSLNTGDPGYPADGSYVTGAGSPPATTVTITSGALGGGPLPLDGTNDAVIVPSTPIAFDAANPKSYAHSLPITIYDSLGNSHQVMQYFVKKEAIGNESTWDVHYTVNGSKANITVPAGGVTTLTFDSTGRLMSGGNVALAITNPGGTASPAADMNIAVSYAGSTQFGGDFSPNFTQNGFTTGEYAGMTIGSDGAVMANYTNGEAKVMGFVALADFNNLQGLQPAGGNVWIETAASGQPYVGRPGENSLASIKGQAVEESNVDMSQELVKMIIAQRTYQANAQTIKTQDQVLQTLMQMR
ncbi:flagellar hook protein FlgE [Eoetvoesiella caeni]